MSMLLFFYLIIKVLKYVLSQHSVIYLSSVLSVGWTLQMLMRALQSLNELDLMHEIC